MSIIKREKSTIGMYHVLAQGAGNNELFHWRNRRMMVVMRYVHQEPLRPGMRRCIPGSLRKMQKKWLISCNSQRFFLNLQSKTYAKSGCISAMSKLAALGLH